ncbi:hypothetical protein WJX79_000759 [Trebouxia sp. C0005]
MYVPARVPQSGGTNVNSTNARHPCTALPILMMPAQAVDSGFGKYSHDKIDVTNQTESSGQTVHWILFRTHWIVCFLVAAANIYVVWPNCGRS